MLAGWDRSVDDAYYKGGSSIDEQSNWLAERDKCGADKFCLLSSMSNRTRNLLH